MVAAKTNIVAAVSRAPDTTELVDP